jgi:hypothetical protein
MYKRENFRKISVYWPQFLDTFRPGCGPKDWLRIRAKKTKFAPNFPTAIDKKDHLSPPPARFLPFLES